MSNKASRMSKAQHREMLLNGAFNSKKNRVTLKVVCIRKKKVDIYYRLLAGKHYKYMWQRLGQRRWHNNESPWATPGKILWEENNAESWTQYFKWKCEYPWPEKEVCKHTFDHVQYKAENPHENRRRCMAVYQCINCGYVVDTHKVRF